MSVCNLYNILQTLQTSGAKDESLSGPRIFRYGDKSKVCDFSHTANVQYLSSVSFSHNTTALNRMTLRESLKSHDNISVVVVDRVAHRSVISRLQFCPFSGGFGVFVVLPLTF